VEVAYPFATLVDLNAVLGLANAALSQRSVSHLLALHHFHELRWKAEEVLRPGEHRDYEGGPPLDGGVGRRLECRQNRLKPRRTGRRRGHRTRPRGARGSGPEGSKSFLILVARWPSAAMRRRRSGCCRRRCLLPAPLWAIGSPFPRSSLAAKSSSHPDGSCGSGRGSGCGCGCKGYQGFLVAAPLRAAAFSRRWWRSCRHRSFLPAPFLRDPFTSDVGTSRRRHGWAEL
jgi:hypothetical protein